MAVGAVLPELSDGGLGSGYVAIGAGFGLLGVVAVVYGALRERDVSRALAAGGYAPFPRRAVIALSAAAVVLGIAAIVVVVANAV